MGSSPGIVASRPGLLSVGTSVAPDIMGRLWCVAETCHAFSLSVDIKRALSQQFLVDPPGGFTEFLNARTETAQCSCPGDEQKLKRFIRNNGGFDALDSL